MFPNTLNKVICKQQLLINFLAVMKVYFHILIYTENFFVAAIVTLYLKVVLLNFGLISMRLITDFVPPGKLKFLICFLISFKEKLAFK